MKPKKQQLVFLPFRAYYTIRMDCYCVVEISPLLNDWQPQDDLSDSLENVVDDYFWGGGGVHRGLRQRSLELSRGCE